MLTVDKPVKLKKQWPLSIKNFFDHGDGPHWWGKNNIDTPYKVIEGIDLPKDEIIKECNKICKNTEITNRRQKRAVDFVVKSVSENCISDLPFYNIKDKNVPFLTKLIEKIGYTKIIDVSIQTLKPNGYLKMHKDDHYARVCYPFIKGCKKLYWSLTDYNNWYFKLGKSGLLPLDKPLLINTLEHVHSVITEREDDRIVLIIYGDLPDDK